MKKFINSGLFRKSLILTAMLIGLAYVGNSKTSAALPPDDCCSVCNTVWDYCLTHYGAPNDPYKTYYDCVNALAPGCADLICTPGC